MDQIVKRGFAYGDNAASAARRNHELGTAHRFNASTAAAAGKLGSEQRWARERARASSSALTARHGPVTPDAVPE